jgi:hypothetical protein
MTPNPASSALAHVRRAAAIAGRHHVFRALCRGVAAGALSAAVLTGLLRLLGVPPGGWPALALIPAVVLTAFSLRGVRLPLPAAALLLDRAAGTKERFLAAVTTKDEEIRDLAAEQALADPAFADGGFPLQFPPAAEGLIAALSVALLLGVVILTSGGEEPVPDRPGVGGPAPLAGLPGAEPAPVSGNLTEIPPESPRAASPAVERVVEKLLLEGTISEEDLLTLTRAGLAEKTRREVVAALGAGDAEAAARAVRRGLGEALSHEVGGSGSPARESGWEGYHRALEAPVWGPEYDRVVRGYFDRAREAGLR